MQELHDAPLAPLTTFRLGGPATRLLTATTDDEVIAAVREADASGTPLLVIGGGSNLVIGDKGFEGTALRIATRGFTLDGTDLTLAAGENWSDAVARTVAAGLAGIECLAGIPGSAGATPIQNVGAYGQEVSSTIAEVVAYDRTAGETVTLSNAECAFSYRHSRFKEHPDRFVVLRVRFALEDAGGLSAPIKYAETARTLGVEAGERVPAADARETVLKLRAGKGMVLDPEDHDTWSAGSFFTNPVLTEAQHADFLARVHERLGADVTPPAFPAGEGRVKTSAAWLIDRAGFTKGYGDGPARISTKHTLALTNRGGATTEDLLALAREVREGVRAAFGITLVNEPVTVGVTL
ncbi:MULTISPECIES: UDP-N-acetylmuramate dehydrogenase [Streptomyces]|uniref:UDP-N-acetylenolpyruvoylglucosamine reductase n=2 Tax=Streptomyces rimosus subsp. rimosus TaxID=132474 RepID=L8EXI0_STRR1|nr:MULTISPECIES: UDP-N-acetylmuramate dehydrogenase [Streptomyces]KOG72253.1 UDP-N-acetylenolpyruvoylglucosamine reductase [Kitasatospora aureofaciens]MYT43616.1 UDP-N-acetylmuramate dehydrogenase [Streptomyces sp. SID5471]KEF02830.1 UDP-N-acetylenolpyruvoylglucosamine reductase [Streptomyces rimosus]KEF18669.1 UDP-N-acetylenolpyruvoylglucosamine reductase [Streptomyces rimosus]KUJ34075.1 UDP-N-acetylenolpyruvoylglucosamine reductase [Streptomyces rimosus subsp. rimosus]